MIDGSEKRNRQLAFELQYSHVCEKRSNAVMTSPSVSRYRYLEKEHLKYCYEEADGMAKLPLNYVYINGFPDPARATSGKLPNGDVINATKSYTKLLSFFTSGRISPEDLQKMGYKKLNDLLEQVRESHMGAWLWPLAGLVVSCPGNLNPRPLF